MINEGVLMYRCGPVAPICFQGPDNNLTMPDMTIYIHILITVVMAAFVITETHLI